MNIHTTGRCNGYADAAKLSVQKEKQIDCPYLYVACNAAAVHLCMVISQPACGCLSDHSLGIGYPRHMLTIPQFNTTARRLGNKRHFH